MSKLRSLSLLANAASHLKIPSARMSSSVATPSEDSYGVKELMKKYRATKIAKQEIRTTNNPFPTGQEELEEQTENEINILSRSKTPDHYNLAKNIIHYLGEADKEEKLRKIEEIKTKVEGNNSPKTIVTSATSKSVLNGNKDRGSSI